MIHAFPGIDDRITVSTYKSQKVTLTSDAFMHPFNKHNRTLYKYNITISINCMLLMVLILIQRIRASLNILAKY